MPRKEKKQKCRKDTTGKEKSDQRTRENIKRRKNNNSRHVKMEINDKKTNRDRK